MIKKGREKIKHGRMWAIPCIILIAFICSFLIRVLTDSRINYTEDEILQTNPTEEPFADEEVYRYIKGLYEETDWNIQYLPGDESKFTFYKEQFIRFLKEECSFVNNRGYGETLSHFGEIDQDDFDYDPRHFNYYFYDVDGDGTPELGMTDKHNYDEIGSNKSLTDTNM